MSSEHKQQAKQAAQVFARSHPGSASQLQGPRSSQSSGSPDSQSRKAGEPQSDQPVVAGPGQASTAAMTSLFGGMYDGGEIASGAGKGAAKATTGLGAYHAVPDDFVGPLLPEQLRQSQYSELQKYLFGQFDVVPDDFARPLLKSQMRQGEFDRLVTAWLNIKEGRGMNISGRNEDIHNFKGMLRRGMTDSPVFRELITDIGSDADRSHQIEAKVGRGQSKVLIDDFETNEIDLEDLEQYPAAPGKQHQHQLTQTEWLAHVLAERQFALQYKEQYNPAHQHGLELQNQYRAERGQSDILAHSYREDSNRKPIMNVDGTLNGDTVFANGLTQTSAVDGNGKIKRIFLP